MASISLILVLLALALLVAWVTAWPLLGAWRWVARVWPRMAAFNVLALSVPVLVGLIAAVGAVWPAASVPLGHWTCHCNASEETIHLCLAHPAGSLPLLPGAVFLLIWLGWRPVRVVQDVARRLLATWSLRRSGAWDEDLFEQGILIGDLGTPNAFTMGLLRTAVLADRGWWSSLSAGERKIVAAHEQAHARCRDPLTHAAGCLLAGLVPERLSRPLLRGWLSRAEHRADMTAARAVGDTLTVAEFLVRQARQGMAPSLIPAFSGGELEGRVRELLSAPDRPPRLASDLGLGLPLTAAALAAVGLFGFQIHSLLEHLLRLHP